MSGVRSGGEVRQDSTVQMVEVQLAFFPEKIRRQKSWELQENMGAIVINLSHD